MDEAMCLPSGSKNTDFTRDELIKLLVYFEGELEAKEIAIAALKVGILIFIRVAQKKVFCECAV